MALIASLRGSEMDITMVLGGAIIAMLQGMEPAGAKRAIAALHTLANRASCSPAERHVLQTIADAVDESSAPIRKPFEVIQGGAA
jgi:hypothetical protein